MYMVLTCVVHNINVDMEKQGNNNEDNLIDK